MKTHLIELIAQVYRVDVIAFEVREHDDLRGRGCKYELGGGNGLGGHTKKTMVNKSPAAMRTANRNSHPIQPKIH